MVKKILQIISRKDITFGKEMIEKVNDRMQKWVDDSDIVQRFSMKL